MEYSTTVNQHLLLLQTNYNKYHTDLNEYVQQVIDIKWAFLKGRFGNCENLYLCVPQGPQGLEENYNKDVVLHLQRAIYGFKQATSAFWSGFYDYRFE